MTCPEPWDVFTYDPWEFPFHTLVAMVLGVETKDLIALASDAPLKTWETDQKSEWHNEFYRGFHSWRILFDLFIDKVIAPRVGEPFFYQNVPTFRVHEPDNLAVGEFHTDAVYHHPGGELTFWVPLTDAHDTSSLWVVDDEGVPQGVTAKLGDVVQFEAVSRLHGNFVNTTGKSRVSFDFRCLPTRLLPEVEGPPTKHTKMRFVPGEYYAADTVVPGPCTTRVMT